MLRGIRYQVAVRYNSCVSIHTFEPLDIPVGNPTITQRRLPAICGSQVNFEYDVTNITTATSIDWDVYDYPMDPTAPTTASSKLSGTATVTGGKAKITGTTSSLNLIRGNQYILVVKASGASPQCAFGYKIFLAANPYNTRWDKVFFRDFVPLIRTDVSDTFWQARSLSTRCTGVSSRNT